MDLIESDSILLLLQTQQDLLSHMVMQDGNRIENSEKQGTQSKATQQAHRAPNGRQTHPTQ